MRRFSPLKCVAVLVCLTLTHFATMAQAQACSFAHGELSMEQGPAPDGVSPPEKPTVNVTKVTRGQESSPDSSTSTSCNDLGVINLHLPPKQPEVGYEFALTDGAFPERDFTLPSGLIVPTADNQVSLVWHDEANVEQEPIDFTLVATAVDKWGQRSEPSAPIHIQDPGREAAACSTGGMQTPAGWAFVPLALIWLVVGAVRRGSEAA